MSELLSIIVPVHNVKPYLDRCIKSIVNQTYKAIEIIIVDDGSTDGSSRICDEWGCQDERIKIIHKLTGGPSSARNAALDMAQGAYFYFVDGDDYIDLKLCEKMITLLEDKGADIITFNVYMVDEEGNKLGTTEKVREGLLSQENALMELMKGNINHYSCNKIYKRSVFNGVRFPEGRVWEDAAISYKLFLNSKKIYCSTEKLYYYVRRAGSITKTVNEKALADIYLARYESYLGLKNIYPCVADVAFSQVVLSALRLYDRSLWSKVDVAVLEKAKEFLEDNKERIVAGESSIINILFYYAPKVYAVIRKGKHIMGELLRNIRKRLKKA